MSAEEKLTQNSKLGSRRKLLACYGSIHFVLVLSSIFLEKGDVNPLFVMYFELNL